MTKQPTLAVAARSSAALNDMLNRFVSHPNVNVGVIDRLASLFVGAMVVLLIVHRFFLYCTLLLVGGYLLYRGVTGYCPLYASEQIDTRHWRIELPGIKAHRSDV